MVIISCKSSKPVHVIYEPNPHTDMQQISNQKDENV
ncbi:hypothetical protein Lser_V15G31299 [Lactuca serriola]